jgi:hypothetical protein
LQCEGLHSLSIQRVSILEDTQRIAGERAVPLCKDVHYSVSVACHLRVGFRT